MLHYGGDELFDVHETFNLGADDQNYMTKPKIC